MDRKLLPLFTLNGCGAKLATAGYRVADLVRGYEELCDIMGEEWIRREKSRRAGGLADTHPLLGAFGTADVEKIAAAMELVVAFRQFKDDPRLTSLLSNLRDWDQFDDFYYALRIALRFKLLGCDVTLEPDIPGGKADALVSHRGVPIGIECANVRSRIRGRQPVDDFNAFTRRVSLPHRTRLEIRLKVPLDGKARRAVRSRVAAIIRQWKGAPLRRSSRLADLLIRRMNDTEWERLLRWDGTGLPPVKTSNPGDAVALQNRVMAGDKNDLTTYDFSTSELQSVVVVRFAEPDEPPTPRPEDAVDRRVSRKMGQMASHPPEWTSALFVNIPSGIRDLDGNLIWQRLSGVHFPRCENLSVVVVTENTWTPWGTNTLSRIPFANAAARRMFPDDLMVAFWHQEDRLRVAALLRQ